MAGTVTLIIDGAEVDSLFAKPGATGLIPVSS